MTAETTVRLWLVRHGSTGWSEAGRYTGSTDVALSERGRSETKGLGWLGLRHWDGIWSSGLIRARDTAKIVGVEAVIDERLREIDFGRIEGMTWEDLDPEIKEGLATFEKFVAPDGESTAQLLERLEAFVGGLTPGDHLVFTHGGVIRALFRTAGEDCSPDPGAVAILEVDAGRRNRIASPAVDNGE